MAPIREWWQRVEGDLKTLVEWRLTVSVGLLYACFFRDGCLDCKARVEEDSRTACCSGEVDWLGNAWEGPRARGNPRWKEEIIQPMGR